MVSNSSTVVAPTCIRDAIELIYVSDARACVHRRSRDLLCVCSRVYLRVGCVCFMVCWVVGNLVFECVLWRFVVFIAFTDYGCTSVQLLSIDGC